MRGFKKILHCSVLKVKVVYYYNSCNIEFFANSIELFSNTVRPKNMKFGVNTV